MNQDWDSRAALDPLRAVIDAQDRVGLKNQLIDRIQWDSVRRALPLGGRVLDLGCGTGRFAERIARRGFGWVGLDYSAAMLAAARAGSGERAVTRGSVVQLPFARGSFAAVLVVGVWQFLDSTARRHAMAEARRVLVDNGRLIAVEHVCAVGAREPRFPSELEYAHELAAARLNLQGIERMRSGDLSSASVRALAWGRRLPRLIEPALRLLARHERVKARRASESELARAAYYDVMILAGPGA